MYTDNPRLNAELRQRLPSPARQQLINPDRSGTGLSLDHIEWPQASQHLQDHPSSCSPSPLSHRRSVSPVSPLFHRRFVSPLSSRPSGGAGEMEMDPSRDPSPRAESCGDEHGGGGAPRGPGSPGHRRHLVTADGSLHQDVSVGGLQSFDRDRNISFLLKELDALRELNKKLQDQLLQKEKELQRREVEEELREEQREARGWERPAAVLEEVLAAQKDRDQALMSRLLLANEERDEALLRARRLQQAAELERSNLLDSDMDVDELLQCVCDANSVQEVEQFGLILVQRLQLARQRRNDITAQEMKAVMEERDGSVARCKRLEQDLIQEREQRATKEELLRLQREKDGALDDMWQLEAELQVQRADHSFQHLLTPPPSLPVDGVSSMSSSEALSPEALPPQTPPLLVQLQQLSKEKQSVEAELQRCQEAEREAGERVRRLERLVEVLRKKVGTGSLRAVI
ncbi:mirror-image polydactyly gene 1 protein isoform X1 [Seriola lalandi dorsalis]|uniref:mirror-image polydactyly gene 1 protein isoform X1 n=1 Tax=Seriola lalandi dorsalis TaxID=1841481 RepID=UPI000C6F9588|nr:mirror-image polydactyly gene 1 protein isoform X1 [Seriola lalandi dorsalis]XP_056250382.1 mirror-image polydactyly gene 1 protein isoform X2 [Seriola aureovittata]